ncbi:MAG: dihydropteroate synthase [Micrococcus sp.]|nr:dihydropteroate synthase [Micrococcus sp.]MDY6054655.1 dihydropteroate synthase [Micrococcus sp.]
MGILNVTPDSFSDGGRHADLEAALAHARAMLADGADVIDVGGESTRPGAEPVSPALEQARVLPVVEALLAEGAVVSVDTMHTATARAALELGPVLVNDVAGLAHEPDMPALIAQTGAPYVLMHNRGTPRTMDALASYGDTVAEVVRELQATAERFLEAGVRPEQLILDPGLGFAKAGEQNWELLRGVERIQALGYPVLVAASRKRFLGQLLEGPDGVGPAPEARDGATAAISAIAASLGVWGVRVHDVRASVEAVRVGAAWRGIRPVGSPADLVGGPAPEVSGS